MNNIFILRCLYIIADGFCSIKLLDDCSVRMILYGDFSYTGTGDIYNRSSGVVFTGYVVDYWLSYYEAQDEIDYYCL